MMNPESALLLRHTEQALNLVRFAIEAHRNGSPILERLYAESQRSYEIILAGFSTLTDEEADSIEPIFTDFEQKLDWLSRDIAEAGNASPQKFFTA